MTRVPEVLEPALEALRRACREERPPYGDRGITAGMLAARLPGSLIANRGRAPALLADLVRYGVAEYVPSGRRRGEARRVRLRS